MIRAYIIHHFITYMHWIMYSTVQALNNVLNVAIGESHLDQVACEFFSHPPFPKLTEGGVWSVIPRDDDHVVRWVA